MQAAYTHLVHAIAYPQPHRRQMLRHHHRAIVVEGELGGADYVERLIHARRAEGDERWHAVIEAIARIYVRPVHAVSETALHLFADHGLGNLRVRLRAQVDTELGGHAGTQVYLRLQLAVQVLGDLQVIAAILAQLDALLGRDAGRRVDG